MADCTQAKTQPMTDLGLFQGIRVIYAGTLPTSDTFERLCNGDLDKADDFFEGAVNAAYNRAIEADPQIAVELLRENIRLAPIPDLDLVNTLIYGKPIVSRKPLQDQLESPQNQPPPEFIAWHPRKAPDYLIFGSLKAEWLRGHSSYVGLGFIMQSEVVGDVEYKTVPEGKRPLVSLIVWKGLGTEGDISDLLRDVKV